MRASRAPVLIYDADCGFCRAWIARWRRGTGDRVRYVPFQRAGVLRLYGVRRRDARRAAQLVEPDGRHHHGAPAMLRALLRARSPWWRAAARAGLLPGVRLVANAAYRFIAAHRRTASRIQRVVERIGRSLGPRASRHPLWAALSRPGLPARGLGLVYVAAFASLRRQVLGLYGARGIRPVKPYLAQIDGALGEQDGGRHGGRRRWAARLRAAPSLLWLDASDAGLVRLCRIGELAGAALALGVAPRLAAFVAWSAFLSFVSVGREFLRFQWDVLLLEAGLYATLGRPRRLLMRGLAFRLQLESGLAKLASRDPTWRDLSACSYHHETQPLPTPLGWYAHHLPRRVQRAATALTLGVECGGPFLAFGPRRLRQPAFALLTGFQALIALTGNYAYFNWLTAVLNLAIVERPAPPRAPGLARAAAGAVEASLAATLLALQAAELGQRLRPEARVPAALDRLAGALAPAHVVGSYGLFSVMTTERPEIVVEGSDDGETWRAYELRYKPGDVGRAPRWIAPHQPRLDWQMWFAALGAPPSWFPTFVARLLQGSPEVLGLLAANPFPERPPRYVRALLYEYRMTDLDTRRRTGAWWRRTLLGLYFGPAALRAGDS